MNLSVYRYVQRIFQTKFPEWYLMNDEQKKGFASLVDNLLENGYQGNDIKNGVYDNEIANELNRYVDSCFTVQQRKDCRILHEYVYEISHNSEHVNFNIKYNIDCLNYINAQVMMEMFPEYSESKLDNKEFEQKILNKYVEKYKEMFNGVFEQVKNYLGRNFIIDRFIAMQIDFHDLAYYVSSQILINNNHYFILSIVDSKDVDNSKNDIKEKIEKYANQYVSLKKKDYNQEKLQKIYGGNIPDQIRLLVSENYRDISDQLLNSCVRDVINRLVSNDVDINRITDELIVSYIGHYFNERQARMYAARNSIKNDKVPSRIRAKRKTRRMNKQLMTLLLAATLLAASAVGVSQAITQIQDANAEKNIVIIDDYDYHIGIHAVNTPFFDSTVDNIIDTFDEYSQFDNVNYKYLGFYRAYDNVKQDRLHIMDEMLVHIKEQILNDGRNMELYRSISLDDCYLEFMYNRLYEMGFEDIKKDKYQNLLNKYIAIKNEHPDEEVVKYLSPEKQMLLERVRDEYLELSQKHLLELGELLGNKDMGGKHL